MSKNLILEKKSIIENLIKYDKELIYIENEFEIEFSDLKSKIKKAISNIKNDLFSIAFFGAFSDGKSTILSILTNKLDIDISPEPTTDKIQPYIFKDYQIIDTPGLFSENLIHDDLTKKYISEANIIIYTVDPVNPLKESHLSTIKWILLDLEKSDSTIFVVNKMDEIADLEDEDDFIYHSKIKKEVVSNILDNVVNNNLEKKIVCISADPFEQGVEFWSQNQEDYKRLSRINHLEMILSEFKSKYKSELILKAGISVISETKNHITKELNDVRNELLKQEKILKNQISEYQSRLNVLNEDINRSYINIKEDFISLRRDILIEIDAINNSSEISETIQRNIGEGGYILEEKIDLIINKYTKNLLTKSKEIFVSLEESLVYHSRLQQELIGTFSKIGKNIIGKFLSKSTNEIAKAILKTRDFLKIPFKFKPWGAMSFAKHLKMMPVVMEVLVLGLGIWKQYKLEKKRDEIKKELEKTFKKLINRLTLENYKKTYFPFLIETQEILDSLEENKKNLGDSIIKIDLVINRLERNFNY